VLELFGLDRQVARLAEGKLAVDEQAAWAIARGEVGLRAARRRIGRRRPAEAAPLCGRHKL